MIRIVAGSIAVVLALAGAASAQDEGLVPVEAWPISGTSTPDGPLSSTFGPRLMASEGFRYDFHRGIDIPTPWATPVHAVAAGEVRLAGDYSFYQDTVVQLRHSKPDGTHYYSNYLHLSAVLVAVGATVEPGDPVGLSGASASGFEHLHFEIRDGGIYQRNCVHPFAVLPYEDRGTPQVAITAVDASDPAATVVSATVQLPRADPHDDLDFQRIEVEVRERRKKSQSVLVDAHAYDVNEWNRLNTPPSPEDPNVHLDDPDFNGVSVSPARFNASTGVYEVAFTFTDLAGANPDKVTVIVRAVDAAGGAAEATWSPSGGGGNGGGKGKPGE